MVARLAALLKRVKGVLKLSRREAAVLPISTREPLICWGGIWPLSSCVRLQSGKLPGWWKASIRWRPDASIWL